MPGEVSVPVRNVSGFHIVRINELRSANQRSSIEQTNVRHILIMPNEIIDDATAQQQLDNALERIEAGELDPHQELVYLETRSRGGEDLLAAFEDGSKLWWDIRPSVRFPTLEMRISDICTRVEDTICIAAIYRCWLRMLYRLRARNQRWREYRSMLLNENRWRAMRYSFDEGLIDLAKGTVVPFEDLLEEPDALVLVFVDRIRQINIEGQHVLGTEARIHRADKGLRDARPDDRTIMEQFVLGLKKG